jgi:hypothetical protein
MMQDMKEGSMSHVDEGTLHAYLDGELPSTDRSILDAHLAQCEPCRARLADERALRERASALLGAARPVERPLPPFEELRRVPRRSPWRVRTSFAWAASIVLALGLGYYLSELGTPRRAADTLAVRSIPGQDELAQNQTAPPAPAPAPAIAERRRAAPRASQRHQQAQREQRKPSTSDTPALGKGRIDSSALEVAARAGSPATAPQAAIPAPRSDSVAAYTTEVAPAIGARMQRREVPSQRSALASAWPRIDRQTAKAILGEEPVGIPDLTTRGYRLSPDRQGLVVVEQALDDHTVIQIFQEQSAGAAFDRAGADRLARFVGKLRVEIGGPVSVDSLNRLLELVGPLP